MNFLKTYSKESRNFTGNFPFFIPTIKCKNVFSSDEELKSNLKILEDCNCEAAGYSTSPIGSPFMYDCGNGKFIQCYRSIKGCTDPNSGNFNPDANIDDGTCLFCVDGFSSFKYQNQFFSGLHINTGGIDGFCSPSPYTYAYLQPSFSSNKKFLKRKINVYKNKTIGSAHVNMNLSCEQIIDYYEDSPIIRFNPYSINGFFKYSSTYPGRPDVTFNWDLTLVVSNWDESTINSYVDPIINWVGIYNQITTGGGHPGTFSTNINWPAGFLYCNNYKVCNFTYSLLQQPINIGITTIRGANNTIGYNLAPNGYGINSNFSIPVTPPSGMSFWGNFNIDSAFNLDNTAEILLLDQCSGSFYDNINVNIKIEEIGLCKSSSSISWINNINLIGENLAQYLNRVNSTTSWTTFIPQYNGSCPEYTYVKATAYNTTTNLPILYAFSGFSTWSPTCLPCV